MSRAMSLVSVFRNVATRLPHIVDLAEMAMDKETAGDYRKAGTTILNVLSPGSGRHFDPFVNTVQRAIETLVFKVANPTSEDGDPEYWGDFLLHLGNLKWKVIVIFGDPGKGKTTLGLKLAEMYHERLGYPVDMIGHYEGEPVPPYVNHISMKRLIARINKVARFIDQEEATAEAINDGLTPEDMGSRRKVRKDPITGKPIEPTKVEPEEIQQLSKRIVFVDEAALFFSAMSASGQQASREAARNLNNQIRHLESILILSCQAISEMPRYLNKHAVQMYKEASEETIKQDYKEGMKRETRERWTEVLLGLHAVKTGTYPEPMPLIVREKAVEPIKKAAIAHQFYEGKLADIRAWAWVVASDIGGHTYTGVCPSTPWGQTQTIDLDPEDWREVEEE